MDIIRIPIRVDSPDNGHFQDESISRIHALIASEIEKGVPADRIVLGGFSQGAALALAATIKLPQKIGGCVALSGWALPNQALGDSIATSASVKSPFLVCHGEQDFVVQFPNARRVSDLLLQGGCEDVHLKTYPALKHQWSKQVRSSNCDLSLTLTF
jgi:predicted esterase